MTAAKAKTTATRAIKVNLIALMLVYLLGGPAVFTALTGCSSGGSATLTGEGTLITLPTDLKQTGIYTVTCYDDFHGRWAAGTGQKEVDELWTEKGCVWTNDIATIDGLYLLACSDTFGQAGDKVKFTLSDGTEISAIIADIKSSSDPNCNEWGHVIGDNCNVLEFEVKRSRYEESGNPGTNGWMEEWANKPVKTCINYGGGGHVQGGGLSGCSGSSASATGYIAEARKMADDNTIGYSMRTRQLNPNVDCASFVWYSLLHSGVSEDDLGSYPFNTYGMEDILQKVGFEWHDYDSSKGMSQLEAGDIVWCGPHTEIYTGDGKLIGAHDDFDGKDGDSLGTEVSEANFYEDGWTRYARPSASLKNSSTSSGGASVLGGLSGCSGASGVKGQEYNAASDEQKAIVDACNTVSSPAGGLCATWVSWVYSAAGWPYPSGNACDMYYAWCTSSNRADLKVGMMVATPHSPFGEDGALYGHIGIYVGDNKVMHSTGSIQTTDLDEWISTFQEPVGWGYPPHN